MNTGGPDRDWVGPQGGVSDQGKLDLALHLLANVPPPLLLIGSRGAGKTTLLRQIESTALPGWKVCYVAATASHSFERILFDTMLPLHASRKTALGVPTETALTELLDTFEKQGRALVLLLDDAGALAPGLLNALYQYARRHSSMKLVCCLRPEDVREKQPSDALALAGAHELSLPDPKSIRASLPEPAHAGAVRAPSAKPSTSPRPQPHVRPMRLFGLLAGGGLVVVTVLGLVHFSWRERGDEMERALPTSVTSVPGSVEQSPPSTLQELKSSIVQSEPQPGSGATPGLTEMVTAEDSAYASLATGPDQVARDADALPTESTQASTALVSSEGQMAVGPPGSVNQIADGGSVSQIAAAQSNPAADHPLEKRTDDSHTISSSDARPESSKPKCGNASDGSRDGEIESSVDTGCTAADDDDESRPQSTGFKVVLTVDKEWKTGYCARVDVKNLGAQAQDWEVALPIKGRVNKVWSAVHSQADNVLKAKGTQWNKSLPAGGTRQFGFCAAY